MYPFAALWDIIWFIDFLRKAGGCDQGKRILEGRIEYLRARIEDIETEFVSPSVQRDKKRKRDDDLFSCVTKGQKLVQEVRDLLGPGGEACPEKKRKVEEQSISFQTCAKLVDFQDLVKRLSIHEKEAGMHLKRILSRGRGLSRGNLIPVRDLFGQAASVAMEQLQTLLQGDEIGRIAIHGIEGIGKTFLMKHLHNSVLNWVERFDHAFWVTFPTQFSIKRVQDAVADALKCDLCSNDSMDRRAEILSSTLAGLGSFVIFLDNVPETHFSLAQVGIPVPGNGSKSKLVLTTRSSVVPQMLNCSGTVNPNRLFDFEACQLLMNEASISRGSALMLKNIPWLLATECRGVPRRIVNLATHLRGVDDPCEWRNTLFEEFKKSEEG